MNKATRVLLVDDHPILREGLKRLLESQGTVQVVGSVETALAAVATASLTRPDVAIIDLSLPDHDGRWLLRQLKKEFPEMPVLVLTMHLDPDSVVSALTEGASGYLTKTASHHELLQAIETVHSGGSYLQPRIAPHVVGALRCRPSPKNSDNLTDRELDILELVADGLSNQAVAERLFVSVSTVKAHLRSCFRKLDVTTRTEVVVEAIRRGLLNKGYGNPEHDRHDL